MKNATTLPSKIEENWTKSQHTNRHRPLHKSSETYSARKYPNQYNQHNQRQQRSAPIHNHVQDAVPTDTMQIFVDEVEENMQQMP